MEQPYNDEEFGRADLTAVDERWHLHLVGEVTGEMRPRLDDVLVQVSTAPRPVDVDCAGVTFIDSSGIGFLSRLGIENPGRVRVVSVSGFTLELMKVSGLPRILTIDAG